MKYAPLMLTAFSIAFLSVPATAQDKGKGGAKPATPVIVSTAYTDRFVDRVEAIGTLKANETVTLASKVTETVTSVNFTDGQRVQKGDILVEMTNAEQKALLNQQQALVKEASKQLERTKELAKSGAASSSILDERQRQYSSTRAELGALQSRLQDRIIVAPFDGVVGLRNTSVGALLQPATRITTLDDDSVMKLDFSVPSVFISTLKPGLQITAKANGFSEDFKGEVAAIDSQIDEATRSVLVRAIIPNPDAKLKPGLLMTVELNKNPRDAVAIPENALIPEGRKQFVFVLDENKTPPIVEKREIIIGTRRQGDVEILEGLKAGDKVVTQGTMVIANGTAVKITAEQKKGESLQDLLKRIKAESVQQSEAKGK